MGLITYDNLEDGQKVTANIFNERFAQIIAQINGQLDENNYKDDSITKAKLKAEVYESIYPVGSMYVNFTDNTNPATLLGFGVWQAVEGRVIVGYDGTQTEFNAAKKTGGAKTHTLSVNEMPSHNHTMGSAGNHNHSYNRPGAQKVRNIVSGVDAPHGLIDGERSSSTATTGSHTHSIGNRGGGQPHNNLQPYITAYVWERIS